MTQISIILPAKDASRFIKKTIFSVLSQTLDDWELIVVNDHSTDLTLKTLNWFTKIDKRIKVFENSGTGIIPALQEALKQASGKYITRIDSDDIMPVDRLQLMKDMMQESPEKIVVTGLVKYFSDEEISEGYRNYESWVNNVNLRGWQWQNIYRECVVASPNWMMLTSDLKKINGFDDLDYPEDYHLVLRWYQNNFEIKCLPEVTLLWREHPHRTSRNSENYAQKAFFNLKVREFIKHDLKSENLALWGTNEKGRLTADILISHGIPFHWMDISTKNIPLKGRAIGHYTDIEQLQSPQLLVAVYPAGKERDLLENYLKEHDLVQGKDWWYL